MPIEIRELHIKVSVTSPQTDQVASTNQSPGGGSGEAMGNEREKIVAACVEKVMEILQNKSER
jgi:hypothetical protein